MVHVAGCTKIAYILPHYLISEHIIKIYSFVKNLQLFSNLSSMNDNSKPLTKDSSTESAEFYSTQDLEEGNLISVSGKTILNNHSGNGNVITEQPLGNKCNEQPTSSGNLFNIVKQVSECFFLQQLLKQQIKKMIHPYWIMILQTAVCFFLTLQDYNISIYNLISGYIVRQLQWRIQGADRGHPPPLFSRNATGQLQLQSIQITYYNCIIKIFPQGKGKGARGSRWKKLTIKNGIKSSDLTFTTARK